MATPRHAQPLAKAGDFLEIQLTDTYFTYARKLSDSVSILLFDHIYASPCHRPEVLAAQPILMELGVFSYTFKKRRWPPVGWAALQQERSSEPLMWSRELNNLPTNDGLSKYNYFLVENEKVTKSVTRDQCRGLSKWAVYVPDTVEAMLRTHYGIAPDGEPIQPVHFYDQILAE